MKEAKSMQILIEVLTTLDYVVLDTCASTIGNFIVLSLSCNMISLWSYLWLVQIC